MEKEALYSNAYSQISALLGDEDNLISNLSNTAAVLKENLGFFWIGFYLKEGNELVLGPFQGPVACTRIAFGRGVCGAAWKNLEMINVPDVHKFPGHIACNEKSRSEIVLPILRKNGDLLAVLDLDSTVSADFNETDEKWLKKISSLIEEKHG